MRLRRAILAIFAGVLAIGIDLEMVEVAETATAAKRSCPTPAAMHARAWPTWQFFGPPTAGTDPPPRAKPPRADTASVLETFNALGYDIERVRKGDVKVPRLVFASLPHDLRGADSPDTRKAVFLAAVLPAVLIVNEKVLAQRQILQSLRICQRQGIP